MNTLRKWSGMNYASVIEDNKHFVRYSVVFIIAVGLSRPPLGIPERELTYECLKKVIIGEYQS